MPERDKHESERAKPPALSDSADPNDPSSPAGDLEPIRGSNESDELYEARWREYRSRREWLNEAMVHADGLSTERLAEIQWALESQLAEAPQERWPVDEWWQFELNKDLWRAQDCRNAYDRATKALLGEVAATESAKADAARAREAGGAKSEFAEADDRLDALLGNPELKEWVAAFFEPKGPFEAE